MEETARRCALVCLKDLACLGEVVYLLVRVGFEGVEEGLGGLGEQHAFAPARRHGEGGRGGRGRW